MKIDEIVTLAQNGYGIDDLRELDETYPDFVSIAIEQKKPLVEIVELAKLAESSKDDHADDADDASEDKPNEPTEDYKALYDNAQAEIEKLKNDVKLLQLANTSKNNADKPDDINKRLEDMVRSFM